MVGLTVLTGAAAYRRARPGGGPDLPSGRRHDPAVHHVAGTVAPRMDQPETRADELRAQILQLTREYHAEAFPDRPFAAGESNVPVSGRVVDAEALTHLVDSSLDFWLTTGRFAHQFERLFAKVFGRRHCILVNSGSSANLVAFSALTSHKLGHKRVKPGDEVITVATGFPTTVNPAIQHGA